jgi:hypothetical protein
MCYAETSMRPLCYQLMHMHETAAHHCINRATYGTTVSLSSAEHTLKLLLVPIHNQLLLQQPPLHHC